MDANKAFLSSWYLAEVLAPPCVCGSESRGCGHEGCMDRRLMDGWVEMDGTWELWCDGRAMASISPQREIRFWPHLPGEPLKAKPRTIDSGMRHIFRLIAKKAKDTGLVEDE